MIRRWRMGAVAGLVVTMVVPLLAPAAHAARAAHIAADGKAAGRAGPTPPKRVLIVSVPRLTWREIVQDRPPQILSMLDASAVASMSVRTTARRTTLGDGYVTIGAGNRADVADADAGNAFGPSEKVDGITAAEVYRRRTGRVASGAVLQLDIASVRRSNQRLRYGAEPGLLGTVLGSHGWQRAVIGNAGFGRVDLAPNRPAALALMDGRGVVPEGDVTGDLLVEDPSRPFGVRTDQVTLLSTLQRVWRDKAAVLLELSDLERADRRAASATGQAAADVRSQALRQVDALIGKIMRFVDPARDLVLLVSPAAPRAREEPTPFAMSGPGIRGGVTQSGTTRRSGYVTLPDVAPTILHAVGISQPDDMTGALIASSGHGTSDLDRYRTFVTRNTVTAFRDDVAGSISIWFVVFESFGLAFALLTLAWRRQALRPWARLLALTTLAFPTVAFLAGLVRVDRLGYLRFILGLFAASVGLALLVQLLGARLTRRRDPRAAMIPPLLLVGLLWAVQVGDILTGGRLQIDTVFGYSPVVAGRFAGYGNLAFALLAISTVVLSTGLWGLARIGADPPSDRPPAGGLALVVAVFLVAVVADGYPSFGSDVGGVLAIVPAGAVVVLLLSGRRVDAAKAALIGAASVIVLAVFAAIDLARPPQARTHLGRLITSTADRGGGGLGTVINRKVAANMNVLTSSAVIWIIPVALVFLAFLTWRRRGFISMLIELVPGVRACLWGGIVVAVLGFALNDSGMTIPAMMFPVLLPYLLHIAVQLDSGPGGPTSHWLAPLFGRPGGDDQVGPAPGPEAPAPSPVPAGSLPAPRVPE